MADKPAFGVFPQMKPRRSQQDREAAKNVPVDLARGFVSGTLGAPGDIEALARLPYELITGNESPTILPTSADIEKRLPFKSDTPVSRAATGLGQLGGGAYTGPLSGVRAVTSIPKAVKQAGRDFVQAAGQSVSPLTVYHGSPHKFEKFDSSKIGTGEGAQSYGRGLYFAESPNVAKTYQPRSPKFEEKLIGLYQKASSSSNYPMMEVLEDAMLHRTPSEIIQKFANAEDGYTKQHAKAAQDFAKWYSKNEPEVGGLYTVDLPDEKIALMLDYDKAINEQAPEVKALLEKAGINTQSSAKAGTMIGGQEEYLAKHGIPGIKYLDEASRSAGEGTRNFVVFPGEEEALTILERKKEGGEVRMKEGGVAFGVFPQMKGKRSKQDPEAAKNVPVDLARGFVAGTLGMPADILNIPGDIYSAVTDKELYRIPFGSEDIEKRLPFRSDTPVSRAATGAGQLAGGFYTGPLSGARAATAIPKAFVQAGKDFVMAAPQGAPRMFIGPKAKTWDQAKADAAARMEKAGVDPVEIWRETGTFRGADGIQRQEISDRMSHFMTNTERQETVEMLLSGVRDLKERIKPTKQKDLFPKALTEAKKGVRENIARAQETVRDWSRWPGSGVKAETILQHPELYKAYPELADLKIVTGGGGRSGVYGQLSMVPGGAGGKRAMEMDIFGGGLLDPKSTALHEMQHAVQTIEGMSPGGSSAMAFNDPRAFEILKRIREDYSKPMSLDEFKKQRYGDAIANPERLAAAYQEYVDTLKPTKISPDLDRLFQEQAANEYYKRLAGEAEARATQSRRGMTSEQRAQEYPYSSYDVLEEDLLTKPPFEYAKGGEVKMDNGGAAFGVFPQMKGKRFKQDPEAAKTFPIDVARGFVSGALGMPGDIESLVRMLPGLDEKTILPTSEDIEKRLPLRSDTPVARAATGLGQIGGGFYTGPLSGARAMTAIPKAIVKGGRDFVMAAGQPAVNVVKPKGGNFLTDRLGRELQYLKPHENGLRQELQDNIKLGERFGDQGIVQNAKSELAKIDAVDQWIDRNLTNYIKNQMATPEDPVRLMLDKRTAEVEAKFAKDMERANRLAERAAAELDPRMKANLTRNAEQAKMEAQADRDLSMSNLLPSQEALMGNARSAAGESRVNRAVEGFPEEGMAKSPAGKAWEDITDSDMGVTANRAGDAQTAVEKKQKTLDAIAAVKAKESEIDEAFIKFMADRGMNAAELQAANKAFSSEQKLKYLKNPELKEEYESLSTAVEAQRRTFKDKDLRIAEQYPWVEKLDPETRLYEFYGSHDLGFNHIIDVLKQDLAAGRITPEQLNRMSVDQAVRRAADFDQEMAKKMREAQIKATEGMPVYKEYPEGYKWVELTAPELKELPEGYQVKRTSQNLPYLVNPEGVNVGYFEEGAGQSGALRRVSEDRLKDALKYEGDTMGHCVGGYCPDVLEGRSRIYSLRDARGEPHVTVETSPGEITPMDLPKELYEEYRRHMAEGISAHGGRPGATEWLKHFHPDVAGQIIPPERIVQIKGKQNAAPKEEYLPYVQDFVKGGSWSSIGDFQNAGLIKTSGAAMPGSSVARAQKLRQSGVDVPMYMTPSELDELLIRFDPPKQTETGMKRGGSVSISDNADAQMMDVLDKQMAGGGLLGKVAKAAKQAKEPSLPLQLPRAPAKTKEEIRPIAQRVAQQMTGEFVRPNPKKSNNPAEKSLKQFQMEKELTHDIRPVEGKTLLPQEVADIEKQLGMLKIGVSGDTTIADKVLHRAGPYELDLPSPQHGGPLFALGGEGAWASNNPTAATFQKRVQELSQAHGDAPTLGQFVAMGPKGSYFALHLADANLRAIDLSKMTEKQIETVNDIIRQGTPKSGPRPGFPGIEDKDSAYLHFAFDPELRKAFNMMMSKPDYTSKLGLPDGRVIQHAITEPELRNSEILTSGLSQMRLDPSVNPADLALSAHPTYSHVIPKVPESAVTRTKYPTPAELEFSDVAEFIKHNYRPKDATRVYQTATPRQMVDPQHIDEMKMYEELMKEYTGKKEGGEVDMAGGGVLKSGLSELAQKIANRFGGFEAARLERAADEVPNLEKLYKAEALERLFGGDNAKGIMTMPPQDFEKFSTKLPFDPKAKKEFPFEPEYAEKLPPNMTQQEYIRYLADLHGFSDIPFLEVNTTPFGKKPAPFISGHEGRHRSRALTEAGQPTSIVQFMPRANLRESMPRRTREEYLKAVNEELDMTNRMVRPQKTMPDEKPRSLIRLPTIYKNGGEVNVAGDGLIKVQKKRKAKA